MRVPAPTPTVRRAASVISDLPHLKYFGGKVMSNPKVYVVLWGGGTYASQIARTSGPNIGSMLTQLTGGTYFDLLSEYSAGGQVIGRGSFAGVIHLSPLASRDGSVIDDVADIQPELKYQIQVHHLPTPDANTLFMLFFPRGKVITMAPFNSVDDFCGYHSYVPHLAYRLRYAVLPDMLSSACRALIPSRVTGLDMMTIVVSHELMEATTDPDLNGWYDFQNGEIGDICSFKFPPARIGAYAVEMGWSNQQGKCAIQGPRRLVSVGNVSVVETNSGKRLVQVPVTLSASSSQTVAMKYTLLNGTAKGGTGPFPNVDFQNAGGTVRFTVPAGHSQTALTSYITVPVYGDTTVETDETLTVRLSSLSAGYGFARAQGTVTILNDDPTSGPTFGVGDWSVRKSDTGKLTVPFLVTLSDAVGVPVTVHYQLVGVTATAGVDFTGPASGDLEFPAGHMAESVNVTILSHTNTDQTLELVLSNPAGTSGLFIGRDTGTGTLAHNH
jgi:hypothetical protein